MSNGSSNDRCRGRGPQRKRQPQPLLQVTDVSKSFGGIAAVNTMSLTVSAGESVGLVGPNGAGKTTLFNCICGQLRPEHGQVELSGTVIDGHPRLPPGTARDRPDLPAGRGLPRHDRPGAPPGRRAGTSGGRTPLARPLLPEPPRPRGVGPGRPGARAHRHRRPGRHLGERSRPRAVPTGRAGPRPRRRAGPTAGRRALLGSRRRRDQRAGPRAAHAAAGARHGRSPRRTRPHHGRVPSSTAPSSWTSARWWPRAPSTR